MSKFIDKACQDREKLRFYTIESLSENRSLTPEGYLLCENATLSRTGTMLYKADEIPIDPGQDGLVTVIRYEADVFKREAVASFTGKSVTNNHPSSGEDVTPENWRSLEVGVILNPRRGTEDKKDCLVADLLIKDAEAIRLIESGKVQLSCGYDADYEQIKPGYAKQFDIIGNHVAIVENGRCGPRCAIMDEDTLRLNSLSPSGKTNIGNRKMSRGINDALISLKAALNKTTINRDSEMSSEEPDTEILGRALEGLNNRLADIEKKLGMRDRCSIDDDDDDRGSRDRRDARRRDDDDDDRGSRDRRHHNDRYSRDDDDDDRGSRDRRDARRRDSEEEEEERRSRDRRDARRRDDDDDRGSRDRRDARRRDSEEEEEERRSRDRRDARRRDDDDDDAHFTDKRKRDEELENEAGEKNKDRARKAKDSAFLEDSWKETISLAECLLPGVQAPKFTRDAAPVSTLTKLCDFRKSVLTATFTKPEGRQLILDLNRGEAPDFQGMSCAAARTLFRDCAIVAKRTNNLRTADGDVTSFGLVKINNPIVGSPTAYNEWASNHWASHYGTDTKKAN